MDAQTKTLDEIQCEFYTGSASTRAILDALYCLDPTATEQHTLQGLCDAGMRELKTASEAFEDVLRLLFEEEQAHKALKESLEPSPSVEEKLQQAEYNLASCERFAKWQRKEIQELKEAQA